LSLGVSFIRLGGSSGADYNAAPKCICRLSLREFQSMTDAEEQVLRAKLAELRLEHSDLDAAIASLTGASVCDQLQLTRLKKHKLQLKDVIARIEDSLLPDITA
jgi:hypothetical protein